MTIRAATFEGQILGGMFDQKIRDNTAINGVSFSLTTARLSFEI